MALYSGPSASRMSQGASTLVLWRGALGWVPVGPWSGSQVWNHRVGQNQAGAEETTLPAELNTDELKWAGERGEAGAQRQFQVGGWYHLAKALRERAIGQGCPCFPMPRVESGTGYKSSRDFPDVVGYFGVWVVPPDRWAALFLRGRGGEGRVGLD